MRQAEVKQVAQALFGDRRSPFGEFSLGSETHHTTNIPDAVRRCRWIAVDLNATGFALFFAGPSAEGPGLSPCFDNRYPAVAEETRLFAGEESTALVKHLRKSTVPLWWHEGEPCASLSAFEELGWCFRTAALAPGTSGIAFPVQAERGQSGLVAFLGPDIAIGQQDLFDSHARCFTLFDAVSRIRPGENGKLPKISKRELECLKLAAHGCTSEDIARLLKLSVHTANQYLTSTTQKLDAVNRIHAVAKALRLGLID